MDLFYRHTGEGKPLIILHGLFGSSDNWMSIARSLSDQYAVYLPDLRNHGNSPNSEKWNYDVMADDIAALIKKLKLDDCSIIGHSLGGKTAMTLARKFPDLAEKLVVVDIGTKYYPTQHQKILDGLLSINIKAIKRRQEADEQLAKYVPEQAIRMFLLKNLDRTEDQHFEWKINLDTINRKIDHVGQGLPENKKIETPTLFIRGGRSDYISEEDFPEIKRIFTNVEIKTIANAGHWVHAEQPDEFLKLVKAFLD